MGRSVRFEEGDLLAFKSKSGDVTITVGESSQVLSSEMVAELADTLLELAGKPPAQGMLMTPMGPISAEVTSVGSVVQRESDKLISAKNKELEELLLRMYEHEEDSEEYMELNSLVQQKREEFKALMSAAPKIEPSQDVVAPRPRNQFSSVDGGDPEVARMIGLR